MDDYYFPDLDKWVDGLGDQMKVVIPENLLETVFSFPRDTAAKILYATLYLAMYWEHPDNYLTIEQEQAADIFYAAIGTFGKSKTEKEHDRKNGDKQ